MVLNGKEIHDKIQEFEYKDSIKNILKEYKEEEITKVDCQDRQNYLTGQDSRTFKKDQYGNNVKTLSR